MLDNGSGPGGEAIILKGTTEEYRVTDNMTESYWFSFYTKEETEKLLQRHGFEDVYFEQFKPSTKNYLNYISIKKEN